MGRPAGVLRVLWLLAAAAIAVQAQLAPFIPIIDSAFQNSFFVTAYGTQGNTTTGTVYRLHFNYTADTTTAAGQASGAILSADPPQALSVFSQSSLYNAVAVAQNYSYLYTLAGSAPASWDGKATKNSKITINGTYTHLAVRSEFPYPGLYLLQQSPSFSIVAWNQFRNATIQPALAGATVLPPGYAKSIPAGVVTGFVSYRDWLWVFQSAAGGWQVVRIDLNLQAVSAPYALAIPADAACTSASVRAPYFTVTNDFIWVSCGQSIYAYSLATVEAGPATPSPALLYLSFAGTPWSVQEFTFTTTESALVVLLSRSDAGNASSPAMNWTVRIYATVNTVLGPAPALYFDFSPNITLPGFAYATGAKLHLAIGQFQYPSFVSSTSFLKNLGEVPFAQTATVVRNEGTVPDIRVIPLAKTEGSGRVKLALAHDLFVFGAVREVWAPLLSPRNFQLNSFVWTQTQTNEYGVIITNSTAYVSIVSGVPLTRISVITVSPPTTSETVSYTFEVESWPFKNILSNLELVTVLQPQAWSGRNYTTGSVTNFYNYVAEPPTYTIKSTNGGPLTTINVPPSVAINASATAVWAAPVTLNLLRDGSNYNMALEVAAYPGRATVTVTFTVVTVYPNLTPVVVTYHYVLLGVICGLFVAASVAFVLARELWWNKGHPGWPPAFMKSGQRVPSEPNTPKVARDH